MILNSHTRTLRQTGLRLLTLLLIAFIGFSCEQRSLPDAPPFAELGFADAQKQVREQVADVYADWEQTPEDAQLNGSMGMHLSVYGKHAAARTFYERARALAPEEFRWAYFLAVTLGELGELETAIDAYREALEIDAEHPGSRIKLAALLLQTSQIDESKRLYKRLTIDQPRRVESWLGLGKTLGRSGDKDGAVGALRRARELGPQYGEVRYALAQALRETGNTEEAASELAAYQQNINNKISQSDELIREISALHIGDESYLAKAGILLSRGDFRSAIALYRKVIELNSANADAWSGLIAAQIQTRDLRAAGETYQQALEAGIEYARLHLIYGSGLMQGSRFDEARAVLQKSIDLDPNFADAYTYLGMLDMQAGDVASAEKRFRRSLQARPNDQQSRLLLTMSLNAGGKFQEAADEVEPLLGAYGVDASMPLTELAMSQFGRGLKDEAMTTLQRAKEAAVASKNHRQRSKIEKLQAKWQELSP